MPLSAEQAHARLGNTITHCVPVDKIIPLRHRILRQGLPLEAAKFDDDDDAMTRHIATFLTDVDGQSSGEPLCCASFVWNEFEKEPAWQLRGMATSGQYRGLGLASRLLIWFEEAIIDRGPRRLMWCNARAPAVSFYEANGWRCVSGEFDIPTAGPHRKMVKRV